MQIRKLEKTLGHRLFERSGRTLALTELGRTVFDYADEIFSLGRELLGALRGFPGKRSGRLHVGIPTFLPKLITYRLMEPVLHLPQDVQLICHEADLGELVAGLSRHRFDVILTDAPIHSPGLGRLFNHPLGDCDLAFCGVDALAARYREGFPESLDGAPVLLPTTATEMRRMLDRWLDEQPFNPRIVGEFDDIALMKEFGGGGAGLFPMPSAVLPEVKRQYGVDLVARIPTVRVRYYAVTSERKLTHPAAVTIAQQAKNGLLREQSP
jgi:LysR family transcriptional activator of nhaA